MTDSDLDAPPATTAAPDAWLPLFPLGAVLMPGGLLALQVFEVRYLDLISRCLREGGGFGVIGLRSGSELRQGAEQVTMEEAGCLAELISCDASGPGRLQVRCRGTRRFELAGAPQAQADGLWVAPVRFLPDEPTVAVPPELQRTAVALGEALEQLEAQGVSMALPPTQLDDALWVAYRWCELLPLSNSAKVALMRLEDPLARLQTIDHILRQHAMAADEDGAGGSTGSSDAGPMTLH